MSLIKISFRDIEVAPIADSIYHSTLVQRAIEKAKIDFPNYNTTNSPDHEKAIDAVIHSIQNFAANSSNAHDIDSNLVLQHLKQEIAETFKFKERRQIQRPA